MLATVLPSAASWITSAQWIPDYTAQTLGRVQASRGAVNRLWTAPAHWTEPDGLGSGVTYAWDPQLCDALLPRFSEDLWFTEFVTCNTLRAAMARAFATWSAHHPAIAFKDLTAACDDAGAWNTSGPSGRGCNAAEVFITTKWQDGTSTDTAATAISTFARNPNFHHTNGRPASTTEVYATTRAELGFSTELCWYLDSTFCGWFHELKRAYGVEATALIGQARSAAAATSTIPSTPPPTNSSPTGRHLGAVDAHALLHLLRPLPRHGRALQARAAHPRSPVQARAQRRGHAAL